MPTIPWRRSDLRKTWRDAKNRNAKAIAQAKLKFKDKLGPALDKLAKLTAKKPTTLQQAGAQAKVVLTLTRQIKVTVDDYRELIDALPDKNKKELNLALTNIYKEALKWEGGISQTESNVKDDKRRVASEGSSTGKTGTVRKVETTPQPSARRPPMKQRTPPTRKGKEKESDSEQDEPLTRSRSTKLDQSTGKGKEKVTGGESGQDKRSTLRRSSKPEQSTRGSTRNLGQSTQRDSESELREQEEEEEPLTHRGRVRGNQTIDLGKRASVQNDVDVQEKAEPQPQTRKRAPRGESLDRGEDEQVRVTPQPEEPTEKVEGVRPTRQRTRRGTFGTTVTEVVRPEQEEESRETGEPLVRPRRGTFGNVQQEESDVDETSEQAEPEQTQSKPTSQDENSFPGMEGEGEEPALGRQN